MSKPTFRPIMKHFSTVPSVGRLPLVRTRWENPLCAIIVKMSNIKSSSNSTITRSSSWFISNNSNISSNNTLLFINLRMLPLLALLIITKENQINLPVKRMMILVLNPRSNINASIATRGKEATLLLIPETVSLVDYSMFILISRFQHPSTLKM